MVTSDVLHDSEWNALDLFTQLTWVGGISFSSFFPSTELLSLSGS
ncbi:hypothetical protein [Nostoc sp. MG11]|nr:hypothetical protein [Nostoc sp. MG11]